MRLIDADALKEEVNKKKVVGRFNTLSLIDAAPTVIWCSETSEGYPLIDLRHREEGEWIEKEETPASVSYYCSVCKIEGIPITPFCPWCGAKMKGGTESVKDARKAVKNESSNNI